MTSGAPDAGDGFSGHERAAEAVVRELSAEADRLMEVEVHDDRTREVSHTSLSRMRVEWTGEDRIAMDGIHEVVDNRMAVLFGDALRIMNDIYSIVRIEQVVDGVVVRDPYGFPLWEVNESGGYVEDYSRLTHHDLRDLLFRITTRLFDWEQKAAQLWGDSMFAKSQWEQAIAHGYDQGTGTVESRTQAARRVSREERLFAIFQAVLSRRADATVRSMERLSQRLKDVVSL